MDYETTITKSKSTWTYSELGVTPRLLPFQATVQNLCPPFRCFWIVSMCWKTFVEIVESLSLVMSIFFCLWHDFYIKFDQNSLLYHFPGKTKHLLYTKKAFHYADASHFLLAHTSVEASVLLFYSHSSYFKCKVFQIACFLKIANKIQMALSHIKMSFMTLITMASYRIAELFYKMRVQWEKFTGNIYHQQKKVHLKATLTEFLKDLN